MRPALRLRVVSLAIPLVLAPALATGVTAPDALAWSNAASPAGGPVQSVGGSALALVASTWNEGTFRSVDGGRHWTRIDGFPDVVEARVEFDPSNPAIGYVAGFGGVARTLDAGATWDLVLDTDASYRIDVSPTGRVAATYRDAASVTHVYVSDDHGATWSDWGAVFPAFTSPYGLRFGRHDGEIVAMSIARTYVTHDAGASWATQTAAGLDLARAADGSLWRAGFSGIERSTDGGDSWSAVAAPANGRPLAARPGGGVFLATSEGLLATANGVTWTNMGFGDAMFAALTIFPDPEEPGAAFVTDENVGIVRIGPAPGGGFALEGRTTGLAPVAITTLAQGGGLLLAGGPLGLYASRDGGDSWSHTGAGVGALAIRSAGASEDGSLVIAGGQNRVFQPFLEVSVDGGRTFDWRLLETDGDGFVSGVAVASSARAFASVAGDLGASFVFETTDAGATWTPVLEAPLAIFDVAWHETSGTLLVATEIGILARAGAGWILLAPNALASAGSIAVRGDAVLASGAGVEAWRSDSPAVALLPWADLPAAPRDLALSADGSEAWAALANGALVRCGGAPVACATETPPGGQARAALEAADGSRAFAATTANGVWAADL